MLNAFTTGTKKVCHNTHLIGFSNGSFYIKFVLKINMNSQYYY